MIRGKSVSAMLVATFAFFTVANSPSLAQVTKPFKVVGAGLVEYVPIQPNVPVPHFAIGEATELGLYFGYGEVQLLGFISPTTANFDSAVPFVFIAANGDRLVFTYGDVGNGAAGPGQVTLSPASNGLFVAVWVAQFNPVPSLCTGRFAKVTGGSFVMTAVTEPFVLGGTDPVAYYWSGSGSLTYRN